MRRPLPARRVGPNTGAEGGGGGGGPGAGRGWPWTGGGRGAAVALPWVVPALLGVVLAAVVVLRKPAPPLVWKSTIPAPEGAVMNLNPNFPGAVTVSPDGRKIAFSARAASGKVLLYLRDLDQGSERPLAGTEQAQYPFFSPDSRWLAFFTQADHTLKKIDTTGGPPVTLCSAQDGKGGSWGAGNVIVFAPDAATPLKRVASTGGEPTDVTKFAKDENSHRQPRFLPDGRRFFYFARNRDSKESAIRIGSLDGGEPTTLMKATSQAEFASGRLLYVRDQSLMAQPFDPKTAKTTGEAVPIAERVAVLRGSAIALFTVSQNGVLLYHTRTQENEATLGMRNRGGKLEEALGDAAPHENCAFAADGGSRAGQNSLKTRGRGPGGQGGDGREFAWTQADFSRVRNAAYGRFTLDRLIRMLSALDDSVEITLDIRPREGGTAFAPVPGAE